MISFIALPLVKIAEALKPVPRSRAGNAARIFGFVNVMAITLAVVTAPGSVRAAPSPPAALPTKPAELFQTTRVWTVHLKVSPEAWAAMEPEGGGFGPSMFLAPAFTAAADADKNGKLTAAEFRGLAERWYDAWDTEKSRKLNGDQLRKGIDKAFAGPPPGDSGAGGDPPGMNLQGAEGKRNGLASAMGIEFNYVKADLEFGGQSFPNVALRYKGNGTFLESRASIKRSFKVDLNKYVKGRKLAGVSTLNLHNNVTDASWTNDVLAHRLFRDAGVPAPRTAYARVYVTVPGKYDRRYFGLYSLVENVDQNFAAERFGTKKGSIFKPVTQKMFTDLGDDWKAYRQPYDPKTDVSKEQEQRLIELCKLVSHADDAQFAARLGGLIDLDEFARYMATLIYLSDTDSIIGTGQNFFLYLDPKTQKFRFIPWDHDHSFGQFPLQGGQADRDELSIMKPWTGENRFLERVYHTEAFKKRYLADLKEMSATLFQPDRFARQVDEIAAAIRPAVRDESREKLARFDKAVAGEKLSQPGFGGPPPQDGPPPGGPRPDGPPPIGPRPDGPPPPGGLRRNGPPPDGPPGIGSPPPGGPRPNGPPAPGGPGRDSNGPPGGPPMSFIQPIKPFVKARLRSVKDQLAGKSRGRTPGGFSFGGPDEKPDDREKPDDKKKPENQNEQREQFGPGGFLGPVFMAAMDADKDGALTRDECVNGFARWFTAWDTDGNGELDGAQLRAGIDKSFTFPAGPPGAPRDDE